MVVFRISYLPIPLSLWYTLQLGGYCIYMDTNGTIEQLDTGQALEMVREISSRARESGNLDLILGANGKSGRSATGNYSLLAKAIGMTRVHVSRVLKGKVQPSHRTLIRLSEVTGFTLDEISGFVLKQAQRTREEKAA
jgi:transcriptional regulator with XRE-family HTH domain